MSSTNESNDSSGADHNNMQSTSQLQQPINQVTQPYWNPNFNHFGTQWRYPFATFPLYPAPTMNWMPYGTPHYQTYRPPAPYLHQFDPRVLVPAPMQMSIHQAAPEETIIEETINLSPEETQPSAEQDAVPPATSTATSMHPTTPSIQILTGHPETDVHPSSPDNPVHTASSSSTCEIPSSEQDFVSKKDSVPETASGDASENAVDSRTRTSASSSASKVDVHTSLSANPDYASKVSSSTCETQLESLGTQDLPSQPRRTLTETPKLDNIPILEMGKPQEPKMLKNVKCECPNCSTKGGNQKRYFDGSLKHICHMAHCGRTFKRPAYLREHLNFHSGEKNFICQYCDRIFVHKDTLRRHVKLHMNIQQNRPKNKRFHGRVSKAYSPKPTSSQKIDKKKYAEDIRTRATCPIAGCGKIYSNVSNLKSHMKLHSGNVYVCNWPLCGKQFTHRCYRRRHEVTHSGKEDIFCSHCKKMFKYNRNLIDHIYTVHGNSKKN